MAPALTIDDIAAAAARLAGVAVRTPVLGSAALDEKAGATLLLKAEVLQRSGSFKFRGAYNALASLPEEVRRRGVVAVSSGNHAAAVALAASLLGTTATIVMPEDAPAVKLAATRSHGADVVLYDRYHEDREALGARLAAERAATLVHPFDDLAVMAGQGTVGLELADDAGPIDVLVAPLSGGGLLAGAATAVRARHPSARIVGVEPAAGDDWRRSLAAGRRVRIDVPATIADGLRVTSPGRLTFPILAPMLDRVVTVTDGELAGAMRAAHEHLGIRLEPSGAAALAAVLGGHTGTRPGERVGVVLSGGNVDAERFRQLAGGAGDEAGADGGRSGSARR